MPNRPVTRGEVNALNQSVAELHDGVRALGGMYEKAVKDARDAIVAVEVGKKARRRLVIGALVVLLLTTLVTIGLIDTTVSKCFLNPPEKGVVHWACDRIPGYEKSQQETDKARRQFEQFPKQIIENTQQIEKNVAEIERLRREIANLKRSGG